MIFNSFTYLIFLLIFVFLFWSLNTIFRMYLIFIFSLILIIVGLFFLIYKILYWDKFQLGLAPVILGVFFGISILIFMLGIIGEYIGIILNQVRKIPLVVEKERINFDKIL